MEPYLIIINVMFGILPFVFRKVPSLLNHFITIFHEVGHAIAALIFGGQVKSIKINKDGSGNTTSAHALQGGYKITRLLVILSGYSFPIIIGLFIALSVLYDQYMIGFWVAVGVSVISIIFIRNFFGLAIVLAFGLIVIIPYFIVPSFFIYFILALGSLAVAGGIRDLVLISLSVFMKREGGGSDFSIMKNEIYIPRPVGVILEWLFIAIISTGIVLLYSYSGNWLSILST